MQNSRRIRLATLVVFCLSGILFSNATVYGTNDPYYKYQKYLDVILNGYQWQGISGKGVVVAVLDSGVQQNNPDLLSALWKNTKEIPGNSIDDDGNGFVDDYYGYNFIANNADMSVYGTHGTEVASIIAAQRDNDFGITGISPGAKIMSLTVCSDADGCRVDSITRAIKYAVDNGASIINLSLGGSGSLGYNVAYDYSVDYAIKKGVLLVVAAGNNDTEGIDYGNNLDVMKLSPVCNEGDANVILGVGALAKDSLKPAFWGSYGRRVDIFAPGEKVAVLSVKKYSGLDAEYVDGTSFSAPMVAGAAALLKEKHPEWTYVDLMSQILGTARVDDGHKILNINGMMREENNLSDINSISPKELADSDELITVLGEFFFSNTKFYIANDVGSYIVPDEAKNVLATNKVVIDLRKMPNVLNKNGVYKIKLDNSIFGEDFVVKRMMNDTKKDSSVGPNFVTVKKKVPVYKTNAETSRVIGTIKKNIKYEVVDNKNQNWVKIKFGNKKGWIIRKNVM